MSEHTREQFWSTYYAEVVRRRNPWLDYSNERVQIQTFGLTLEAAGPIRNKRCLDVGCGWGDVCRMLHTLGATAVTGIDIVPELIAEQERAYPDVRWLCGSLDDDALVERLEHYDIALLLEVLQLMSLEKALSIVWDRLLPGGRLVAMVPNAGCPIVSETRGRFQANYAPPTLMDVDLALRSLPDLEQASYRGLWFSVDQRIVPYDVSAWRSCGPWTDEPNRIQFVALKRRPAPPPGEHPETARG